MALAEARAVWHRTANRCLVQEDAKRAPKLACCPSPSPYVKPVDVGLGGLSNGQDIPSIGGLSLDRNSSRSNLSPNSIWWLQRQQNYGYQNRLANEQLSASEANMENASLVDQSRDVESVRHDPFKTFPTSEKKYFRFDDDENFQDPLELDDINMGATDCEVSKKSNEFCFDSECSWIGGKRNDTWWRIADTEELAVLVAHRSFDLIENCDLPQPQQTHVKKDVNVSSCCVGPKGVDTSSLYPKPGPESCYSLTSHISGSRSAEVPYKKQRLSVEAEVLLSSSGKEKSESPSQKGTSGIHYTENDTCKAQLLEALRHSQTRAREAEKAARQAWAEKEQIIQLVFKQASQLFAYKQWFQLLQLENMSFQIKNNQSQAISTIGPVELTRVPQRSKRTRKRRGKQSCCRYDISKYAVVFALGLGLVSAGLFLGWSVGCMAPRF